MNRAEWLKILEEVAQDMYDGNIADGDIVPEMVREAARELFGGVQKGLNKSISDESISGKDLRMLEKLQKNVFHFSGAKNFHQLREMSTLLTDANGDVVPFEEFLNAVKTVDETYSVAYLEAEYNHAVATSQMMGKWNDYQSEKDALPYLQYSAVLDDRTRPEHAALDGVVKHIDDPFWDKWFPPNGWNCRCDVTQTNVEEETKDVATPEQDKFFANNPGKSGVVFSNKHPYFKDMPKEFRGDVKNESEKLIDNDE
jgi:SPP1 gp7 family putative phage head morphogenesis protein